MTSSRSEQHTEMKLFVSYAHVDNSHGRIESLVDQLATEYEMQSGEKMKVIIDKEAIEWGNDWENQIEFEIDATTLFMPFYSPSYFRSDACIKEFTRFSQGAQRLGLIDQILGIYYLDVEGLDKDSPNTELSRAATFQYHDWRELRLEDPASSDVQKVISQMASRLVGLVSQEPTSDLLSRREANGLNIDQGLDLVDTLAIIENSTDTMESDFGDFIEALTDFSTECTHFGDRGAQTSLTKNLTILAAAIRKPTNDIEEAAFNIAKHVEEIEKVGLYVMSDEFASLDQYTQILASIAELEPLDLGLSTADELNTGLAMMKRTSKLLRSSAVRVESSLELVDTSINRLSVLGRDARRILDDTNE